MQRNQGQGYGKDLSCPPRRLGPQHVLEDSAQTPSHWGLHGGLALFSVAAQGLGVERSQCIHGDASWRQAGPLRGEAWYRRPCCSLLPAHPCSSDREPGTEDACMPLPSTMNSLINHAAAGAHWQSWCVGRHPRHGRSIKCVQFCLCVPFRLCPLRSEVPVLPAYSQ